MKDALQKLNDREYEKLAFYRSVLKEQKEQSMKTLGQVLLDAKTTFWTTKKIGNEPIDELAEECNEIAAQAVVYAWIERNAEPVAYVDRTELKQLTIGDEPCISKEPVGKEDVPLFTAPQPLPSVEEIAEKLKSLAFPLTGYERSVIAVSVHDMFTKER